MAYKIYLINHQNKITYGIQSEAIDTISCSDDQITRTSVHAVASNHHLVTGPQSIFGGTRRPFSLKK